MMERVINERREAELDLWESRLVERQQQIDALTRDFREEMEMRIRELGAMQKQVLEKERNLAQREAQLEKREREFLEVVETYGEQLVHFTANVGSSVVVQEGPTPRRSRDRSYNEEGATPPPAPRHCDPVTVHSHETSDVSPARQRGSLFPLPGSEAHLQSKFDIAVDFLLYHGVMTEESVADVLKKGCPPSEIIEEYERCSRLEGEMIDEGQPQEGEERDYVEEEEEELQEEEIEEEEEVEHTATATPSDVVSNENFSAPPPSDRRPTIPPLALTGSSSSTSPPSREVKKYSAFDDSGEDSGDEADDDF